MIYRAARLFVIAVLLAATAPASAQTEAERKQQELETRAKLEQVRSEIERESQARTAVQQEHAKADAALREIELAVSTAARAVAETQAEIARREADLLEAQSERTALEKRLAGQRNKLSTLLRSAYQIGRDHGLRSWLARDRLQDTTRLIAYNRYLQKHRLDRMHNLLVELQALVALTEQIAVDKRALDERRSAGEIEIATLSARRAERALLIDTLNAQLATHKQRLDAYARDEQSMLKLLERLRDVLADIPRQLAGAAPLAQQRGRLPWPATGKIRTAFGSTISPGRVSDGIVIDAEVGAEVHAIAHGRVAYADWLRGFGLLIIVDHGEGFMSLYAHNEALLKDEGDWVQAGSTLARSGASGGAEQSGLYFELRKNSQPLDPKVWLQKR